MSEPLSKVDSAVQGLATSPPKEKRRQSSAAAPGVKNVNDLGMSLPRNHHSPMTPHSLGYLGALLTCHFPIQRQKALIFK